MLDYNTIFFAECQDGNGFLFHFINFAQTQVIFYSKLTSKNILTCQFAVENHLSLGKIDKVKKKPVPILTLRKEYGIVIKHRINFHSSA